MSLPSRPESSQLRSAPRLASGPRPLRRDALGIGLATPTSSPCRPHHCGLHESLAFLEFPCPSTFEQLQRPALQNRLSLHLLACRGRPACARPRSFAGLTFPTPLRPRGFAPPRRFFPQLPSGLVSCRCRPWAFVSFEGFSPPVAREPLGPSCPPCRYPACAAPASRISASFGRVVTASWV